MELHSMELHLMELHPINCCFSIRIKLNGNIIFLNTLEHYLFLNTNENK